MPTADRRGSAFIYCIALSSIVVVIAFGFLRATMRDTIAGDRSQHVLLAQAAARAGLAEATEAILYDYVSTDLLVGTGSGAVKHIHTLPTDPPPPTFLDGPYRAPFVSKLSPDRLYNVDESKPDNDNDVRPWNTVINPMTRLFDHDATGQTTGRNEWYNDGLMMYDGRGRYIEPNFHNDTRPPPTGSNPIPVDVTKVLDLSGTFASPTRHNGLFLDSSLRRIDSTGSLAADQAARAAARYRLRYAIGVIDLGGHLLTNPKADFNNDWQDPNNDYRRPPVWLDEAKEAWYNMAMLFPSYHGAGGSPAMPLRWQHVFQGRGDTSNYDRKALASFPTLGPAGTNGFPVTFPMMFRTRDGVYPPLPNTGGTGNSYWGFFAKNLGGKQFKQSGKITVNNAETTGLYRYGSTVATPAGGQTLWATNVWDYYIHALTGPQASWFNQHQSIQGSLGTGSDHFDGGWYYGEQAPPPETAMFLPTPFGRGVSAWSGTGTRKWYEGRTNTPWYVNVLTAPPHVIHCMLFAYLPPSFKQFRYTEENFSKSASKSTMMGAWKPIDVRHGLKSRDLFTDLAGPAFSQWPAPTDGEGVKPNFLAPDTRTPDQIYPGVMWNSTDCDDLGKDINVNTIINTPYCSHTGVPFSISYWGDYEGQNKWLSGWVTTPPAGWGTAAPGNDDWFFHRMGANSFNSYWWDIMRAFYSAVAVTRAAWVQYPTSTITPNSAFSGTLVRDPSLYDSIEKLDRLFLRQLGENFDNPGTACPDKPITCSGSSNQVYSEAAAVSNIIKTLVSGDKIAKASYTSVQRGRLMELVLNDFRLSFFGASPQYYDRFRPLDFDGDRSDADVSQRRVYCSAYPSNPAATADEVAKGLDRFTTTFDTTYGDGQGTRPNDSHFFSLTGTFYIGKSHYFRMICRGELFDNVVQRPVADATIESVLAVDPEGDDIRQSHYLFQRWHFNRFTGHMSQVDR